MVTATASATGATAAAGASEKKPGELGKDDFLKLLVAQLRNQDPSNAGDSQQFMAQMTQYSILEQITNLAATMERSAASAGTSQLVGLIGRTVTYLTGDGETAEGVVESVGVAAGRDTLTLAGSGAAIDPAAVVGVR
jgi:flagellar basal-body rod modification protein FlgD